MSDPDSVYDDLELKIVEIEVPKKEDTILPILKVNEEKDFCVDRDEEINYSIN